MAATGPAIMEVDLGSVAGTAVDRFLDEPLARGLNGETSKQTQATQASKQTSKENKNKRRAYTNAHTFIFKP